MYLFLIFVHVIVCLVLIFVVLLQAGRGGGFSEMFGGGQPSSILGTQTNAFMTRVTEVCAVVFVITSLSLGLMSAQKSKSLVQQAQKTDAIQAALAQAKQKVGAQTASPSPKEAVQPAAAAAGAAVPEAQKTLDQSLEAAKAEVAPAGAVAVEAQKTMDQALDAVQAEVVAGGRGSSATSGG